MTRCSWCGDDPLYVAYHDREWGVPVHDDRHLFEMLILEGAQAGLSWITILKKRENYRRGVGKFFLGQGGKNEGPKNKKKLGGPRNVCEQLKGDAPGPQV